MKLSLSVLFSGMVAVANSLPFFPPHERQVSSTADKIQQEVHELGTLAARSR